MRLPTVIVTLVFLLHSPAGAAPDLSARVAEDSLLFARGLAAFRAGKFVEARAAFAEFRAANESDAVVALYLDRLASLGDSAPAAWDGVFDHLSK